MKKNLTLVMISILSLIYSCKKDDPNKSLSDGLVAYYPFNGNANDESWSSNNGTVHDATLGKDRFGITNSAYFFNGTSSYIDLGNNSVLKRYATSFSICLWVNPTTYSEGGTSALLSNRNMQTDGSVTGSMVDMPGLGSVGAVPASILAKKARLILKGGVPSVYVYSSSNIELNQWTFITICFNYNGNDQNVVTIYLNGKKQAEGTLPDVTDPGSAPTYIGFESYNVSPLYHFNGYIDDVRIYNRVISTDEINALFKLQ
jgi:hypothetical protein